VLECHVFICKSAEAGIALVQATSYAFEHREGWLSDGAPAPAPMGSSMMFGGSVSLRIADKHLRRGFCNSCRLSNRNRGITVYVDIHTTDVNNAHGGGTQDWNLRRGRSLGGKRDSLTPSE